MYTLVLVRHGESVWNKENRFTGWVDVDLSEKGIAEAHAAGKALKEAGFSFDLAFQSVLLRVTRTLDIILEELGEKGIEVRTSWKLNERHYGALQGLNKSETAKKYGDEQVKIWRRGYDVEIPPIDEANSMFPGNDPLYAGVPKQDLPRSENLKDVVERVIPYWNSDIVPEIQKGRKAIVAASGNSLRALVKHIEGISDADIVEFNFPTGIPYIYEFDGSMNLLNKRFLADPEQVKKAMETVANQGKS